MTISNDQFGGKEPRRKDHRGSMRRCKHQDPAVDTADDGVKRFHGDGLVVRLDSNHRVLEITGDGCRVILSKNSGSVHVVGDGCRVRVNHNVGDIEYTGDGGRVLLGPDSSKEKVRFVGDGGKVIFDTGPEAAEPTIGSGKFRYQRSQLKKAAKDQRNEGADHGRTPRDEVVASSERDEGRHVGEDGCWRVTVSSSNREYLDNALNDMKESGCCQRHKCAECDDQTGKSSRRQVVTKIVTEIRGDGRCVRKRLNGDSSLIVNSTGVVNSSYPAVARRTENFGTSHGHRDRVT